MIEQKIQMNEMEVEDFIAAGAEVTISPKSGHLDCPLQEVEIRFWGLVGDNIG